MLNLINTAIVGYLAGTGVISNAGIVGRGMVRAIRKAAEGRLTDAAVEAAAAVAAPTVLAFATTTSMVSDVIAAACDLVGPALRHGGAAGGEAAA
jgi:hypothetical protein